jgi:type IV pilus assembly protein PilX
MILNFCGHIKQPNKQQGIVLIVALVFLVALTSLAATLMQNTTTDIKMSSASEAKVVALQKAVSAVDRVIYNQVKLDSVNAFSQPITEEFFPNTHQAQLLANTYENVKAQVDIAHGMNALPVDCPHQYLASSVQLINCRLLTININQRYGRNLKNYIEVNAGVIQQLLK